MKCSIKYCLKAIYNTICWAKSQVIEGQTISELDLNKNYLF